MSSERLIIYPTFGQRMSSWDIANASGKYNIPLMETTDKDSVLLYILDPKENIKTIDYNHIHSKELFSIGTNVAIADKISKPGRYVTGYISKINNNSIDIISETTDKARTYRINDYKIISAYGRSNQPDILVVNIKPEDKGKLNLSYLFGNIGWSAYYKIILDNNNIKSCTLAANITDQNSEDLTGEITLVAGSISRPQTESHSRTRSMMAVSSAQTSSSEDYGKFEEYYKYNIGKHKLSDENRIDLVTCTNTHSQKYYSHDVFSRNWVTYGYKFDAPTFFPAGKVYIYTKEKDNILYTGSVYLSEHREGDKVDLSIGKTTQIKAETNLIRSDRKVKIVTKDDKEQEEYEYDIIIETSIDSKIDDPVLFILKYLIGNDKLLDSSYPITRRKDEYLEWEMMANPGTSKLVLNLTLLS